MTTWKAEAKRIGALPEFGIVKHGTKWFLVDMETGAQLGPATHNTKAECIAYAYERKRAEEQSKEADREARREMHAKHGY